MVPLYVFLCSYSFEFEFEFEKFISLGVKYVDS